MEKIKKISETGFFTEKGWRSCDKFKIFKNEDKINLFNSLKEGDIIDHIVLNKKGYVVDFIVLRDVEGAPIYISNHIPSLSKVSVAPSSSSLPVVEGGSILEREAEVSLVPLNSNVASVQDRIMYGQCVNIAFESSNVNLQYEDNISKIFDLADKIYIEYSKRCKR
jgi:hypothetical protein